jgi:hypothetical protein
MPERRSNRNSLRLVRPGLLIIAAVPKWFAWYLRSHPPVSRANAVALRVSPVRAGRANRRFHAGLMV